MKTVHQVLVPIVARVVVEILLRSLGRREDTNGDCSVDRLLGGLRRHDGSWYLLHVERRLGRRRVWLLRGSLLLLLHEVLALQELLQGGGNI